jgi:hypothetical protein
MGFNNICILSVYWRDEWGKRVGICAHVGAPVPEMTDCRRKKLQGGQSVGASDGYTSTRLCTVQMIGRVSTGGNLTIERERAISTNFGEMAKSLNRPLRMKYFTESSRDSAILVGNDETKRLMCASIRFVSHTGAWAGKADFHLSSWRKYQTFVL